MTDPQSQRLAPGETIVVRDRFQRGWHTGFELVDVTDEGYRVRRVSDGQVLERPLAFEDVQVSHWFG